MEAAVRQASPAEVRCLFSREDVLMETAGGLALARDRGLLGDHGSVLVINGDGVLNLDLTPMFARHRESDDLVTMALLPHLDPGRWSRVLLDSQERVSAFLPPGAPDPGEAPFLYPGVMLVSRIAIECLETKPAGVAQALWSPARTEGRLGGVVVSGHWREVGTPQDYLAAVMALARNSLAFSKEATIHPKAVIVQSLIGPGVVVERGARVSHSVVSHGAIIRRDANISHAVILGAVVIPEGGRVFGENVAESPPSTLMR